MKYGVEREAARLGLPPLDGPYDNNYVFPLVRHGATFGIQADPTPPKYDLRFGVPMVPKLASLEDHELIRLRRRVIEAGEDPTNPANLVRRLPTINTISVADHAPALKKAMAKMKADEEELAEFRRNALVVDAEISVKAIAASEIAANAIAANAIADVGVMTDDREAGAGNINTDDLVKAFAAVGRHAGIRIGPKHRARMEADKSYARVIARERLESSWRYRFFHRPLRYACLNRIERRVVEGLRWCVL